MLTLVVDDYSLFYDLVQKSELVNIGTVESRKRRSLSDSVDYQLVEFHFILQRNSVGTLLYSKTKSAIHKLEVRTSAIAIWRALMHLLYPYIFE